MHSKNDSIEIIIYEKADEFIPELLESLISRYKELMKGTDFIFDCANLFHYKFHFTTFPIYKINRKRGET